MTDAITPLYRVLYEGVLSRLPEARALALGQALIRALPIDRLPIFRLDDPRLATSLGGVRLPNPLVFASMYYDVGILRRLMGLGFGAVTTKTITREPRPGHPQPNLARVRTAAGPGLVNCNGFQNPGLERFRRDIATLPHRVPLIVSVAGESGDDYLALAEALAPVADLVPIGFMTYANVVAHAGWRRFAASAAAAGLCAAVWAIRVPAVICLSYVGLGLAVYVAIRQWDLSDRRTRCLLIGVASGVLTSLAVWADNLWSLPVAGLTLLRATITGLAVWWLQRRRVLS